MHTCLLWSSVNHLPLCAIKYNFSYILRDYISFQKYALSQSTDTKFLDFWWLEFGTFVTEFIEKKIDFWISTLLCSEQYTCGYFSANGFQWSPTVESNFRQKIGGQLLVNECTRNVINLKAYFLIKIFIGIFVIWGVFIVTVLTRIILYIG